MNILRLTCKVICYIVEANHVKDITFNKTSHSERLGDKLLKNRVNLPVQEYKS